MAIESNTFLTFSAIGNREDLANAIYRIDPTDTAFFSGAETTKATAVLHEWQTQALAAAADNAQLEGDVFAIKSVTASVRLGNVCQISYKAPEVSRTQRIVKHAGRGDEMTYQVMLAGLELRRDIETGMVGTNKAKASGSSTVARKYASVLSWIKSNTDKASDGSDPVAADGTGTRTDGTARAFTEAQLKNVLNLAYVSGGKPDTIMVGAFNKQQFSTFTGRVTPISEDNKTVIASVSAYDSDFGTLKVVPNRFMRTRDALVLQMDMWSKAVLDDFGTEELAKTSDADKRALTWEGTIEARNEKASGGVFDLTAS